MTILSNKQPLTKQHHNHIFEVTTWSLLSISPYLSLTHSLILSVTLSLNHSLMKKGLCPFYPQELQTVTDHMNNRGGKKYATDWEQ